MVSPLPSLRPDDEGPIIPPAPHPKRGSAATSMGDRWSIVRPAAAELVVAYVVMTAIWVGIGLLITGPLGGSGLVRTDQDISEWFVEQRTPAWDDWSQIGSLLADTLVKIIATAIIAGIMLAVWRSLREPLLVVISLILEASVFITTTWIVRRPRPDVERLDGSPVDSSFPSGHTAAAAAYSAVAIVVFWHIRNVWVRAITLIVIVALPVVVGLARVYRGMHYTTDVVAGTVLGATSVFVVWLVIRHADRRRDEVPAGAR